MKQLLLILFFSTSVQARIQNLLLGNNEVRIERARPSRGLIFIIPAKKYTMEKPLFNLLSKLALKNNYSVARFNWSFIRNKNSPSKQLRVEATEIDQVLSYVQKKLDITNENTFIVAKSFGSRVLMKSLLNKSRFYTLLTPNCDNHNSFSKTYSLLFKRFQDVNISLSINDPYCDVGQIYNFLSQKHSRVTLFTTFGDHNFVTTNKSIFNQETAMNQIINWANEQTKTQR